MKISTKGRYALRLMIDLAKHYEGEPVKLKDIAQRQEISEKYLEQIIASLNKSGLVRSTRGASGGYVLTKKPEEYTAGEIIRNIEGDLAPVECLCENSKGCTRMDTCPTVKMWKELYESINNVVNKYTLDKLVEMSEPIDLYSI